MHDWIDLDIRPLQRLKRSVRAIRSGARPCELRHMRALIRIAGDLKLWIIITVWQ